MTYMISSGNTITNNEVSTTATKTVTGRWTTGSVRMKWASSIVTIGSSGGGAIRGGPGISIVTDKFQTGQQQQQQQQQQQPEDTTTTAVITTTIQQSHKTTTSTSIFSPNNNLSSPRSSIMKKLAANNNTMADEDVEFDNNSIRKSLSMDDMTTPQLHQPHPQRCRHLPFGLSRSLSFSSVFSDDNEDDIQTQQPAINIISATPQLPTPRSIHHSESMMRLESLMNSMIEDFDSGVAPPVPQPPSLESVPKSQSRPMIVVDMDLTKPKGTDAVAGDSHSLVSSSSRSSSTPRSLVSEVTLKSDGAFHAVECHDEADNKSGGCVCDNNTSKSEHEDEKQHQHHPESPTLSTTPSVSSEETHHHLQQHPPPSPKQANSDGVTTFFFNSSRRSSIATTSTTTSTKSSSNANGNTRQRRGSASAATNGVRNLFPIVKKRVSTSNIAGEVYTGGNHIMEAIPASPIVENEERKSDFGGDAVTMEVKSPTTMSIEHTTVLRNLPESRPMTAISATLTASAPELAHSYSSDSVSSSTESGVAMGSLKSPRRASVFGKGMGFSGSKVRVDNSGGGGTDSDSDVNGNGSTGTSGGGRKGFGNPFQRMKLFGNHGGNGK
ncbi:hypothetical protein HDU76_013798 [Blyttiomyces sp. JEL0837]|nr:hypothetical protein HDU76_013798 [Blyttiomyces sp. JEL0837]